MRIRIKTKWSKEEREVSVEDAVSVLAFNSWKIGMQTLLEIENEEFQIDTQQQRIEVLEEIMAFMVQALDRVVYNTLSDEDRGILISMYAKKVADHVQDNARDFSGPGDYRTPFIDKINKRFEGYATTKWNDERDEPSFSMGREFGMNISDVLGPKDKKWAFDYIQQVLMPEFFALFKKTVNSVGLIDEKLKDTGTDELDSRHVLLRDKPE
ncbi:MAG TPA: hypothetical protein EYG71_07010 [Leucothrix sp.]|nr:hypothetical protein [Leucothrix sp.]